MKAKEFEKKSSADLRKALGEYRGRLQQLKFDLPSGKVKNVREIRALRKDIARILTVLHRKK